MYLKNKVAKNDLMQGWIHNDDIKIMWQVWVLKQQVPTSDIVHSSIHKISLTLLTADNERRRKVNIYRLCRSQIFPIPSYAV